MVVLYSLVMIASISLVTRVDVNDWIGKLDIVCPAIVDKLTWRIVVISLITVVDVSPFGNS